MSAFLDNVTTVLIIIPLIIELTRGLGLNPKKYVLSQIIISNIGGAGTLIGDPPNVIIGSKVGLTFNQFLFNDAFFQDHVFFTEQCARFLRIFCTSCELVLQCRR